MLSDGVGCASRSIHLAGPWTGSKGNCATGCFTIGPFHSNWLRNVRAGTTTGVVFPTQLAAVNGNIPVYHSGVVCGMVITKPQSTAEWNRKFQTSCFQFVFPRISAKRDECFRPASVAHREAFLSPRRGQALLGDVSIRVWGCLSTWVGGVRKRALFTHTPIPTHSHTPVHFRFAWIRGKSKKCGPARQQALSSQAVNLLNYKTTTLTTT